MHVLYHNTLQCIVLFWFKILFGINIVGVREEDRFGEASTPSSLMSVVSLSSQTNRFSGVALCQRVIITRSGKRYCLTRNRREGIRVLLRNERNEMGN
jgi:hypothetical protein